MIVSSRQVPYPLLDCSGLKVRDLYISLYSLDRSIRLNILVRQQNVLNEDLEKLVKTHIQDLNLPKYECNFSSAHRIVFERSYSGAQFKYTINHDSRNHIKYLLRLQCHKGKN